MLLAWGQQPVLCWPQGVYLVLEKLKMPAYRRLFRRVALLHAEQEPAKAVQVPLGAPPFLCQPPSALSCRCKWGTFHRSWRVPAND